MTEQTENKWLTVDQAATYLQVHPQTIRTYIKAGKLESSQVSPGGPHRISTASIDALMDNSRKG